MVTQNKKYIIFCLDFKCFQVFNFQNFINHGHVKCKKNNCWKSLTSDWKKIWGISVIISCCRFTIVWWRLRYGQSKTTNSDQSRVIPMMYPIYLTCQIFMTKMEPRALRIGFNFSAEGRLLVLSDILVTQLALRWRY